MNQQIAQSRLTEPHRVVSSLGAMQAQDYLGALWGVGLRVPGSTEALIASSITYRAIVRTWPMRGTLHFVAAEDVRWMLRLLTPRIVAGSAGRNRQLELDEDTFARSGRQFVEALQGGKSLTRRTMLRLLNEAHISTDGQRGIHILGRLAQDGLICLGPREGKQQTFVLLEEWVPESKDLERDEALAKLAKRYFKGHGPATVQDFVWWSGLKVADAKSGLEMVVSQLVGETVGSKTYYFGLVEERDEPETEQPAYMTGRKSRVGSHKSPWSAGRGEPETEQPTYMTSRKSQVASDHGAREEESRRQQPAYVGVEDVPELADAQDDVYMLPGFDEFIVGYRDRSAAIDPLDVQKIQPGTNGMFSPTIVVDGRVTGTWKRTFKKDSVAITVSPFAAMSKRQEEGVAKAAERYGKFLAVRVELVISSR